MPEPISCIRCRKLKIKCSQSFPSCARCARLKTSCSYPPPPDRKQIARTRVARTRRRSEYQLPMGSQSPQTDSRSVLHSSPHPQCDKALRLEAGGVEPARPYQSLRLSSDLSIRTTSLALIETYFDKILNSHLLFRKEELVECYMNNSAPSFILQSIFASSILFFSHKPENVEPGHTDQHYESLHYSRAQSEGLARSASAEIFARADLPSTDNFKACFNLLIYWFSVGERSQVNIHLALTNKSGNLLRYPRSRGLDDESKKRCQWAWSQYLCITDCPSTIPIDLLSSRTREPSESESALWNPRSRTLWNNVIEFTSLWSDTRDFVYTLQLSSDHLAIWNRLCRIDARLDALSKSSPSIANYAYSSDYQSSNELHCGILIWSIYHLCKIVLHVYTSQALSKHCSLSNQEAWSFYEAKCATAIGYHTAAFSSMLSDLLLSRVEVSSITPFVGYCAFVGTKVLFPCLKNLKPQESSISFYIRSIMMPPLVILFHLRCHWHSVRTMWDKIQSSLLHSRIAGTEFYEYIDLLHQTTSALTSQQILNANMPFGSVDSVEPDATLVRNISLVIDRIDLSDPNYLCFSLFAVDSSLNGQQQKLEVCPCLEKPNTSDQQPPEGCDQITLPSSDEVDPFHPSMSMEGTLMALGLLGGRGIV